MQSDRVTGWKDTGETPVHATKTWPGSITLNASDREIGWKDDGGNPSPAAKTCGEAFKMHADWATSWTDVGENPILAPKQPSPTVKAYKH